MVLSNPIVNYCCSTQAVPYSILILSVSATLLPCLVLMSHVCLIIAGRWLVVRHFLKRSTRVFSTPQSIYLILADRR
jgi:hypothetical protein